jgi:hypothetical protein
MISLKDILNEETILVRRVDSKAVETFLKKYPKVKQIMTTLAQKNTDLMRGYKAFLKFKDKQEDYLGGRSEEVSSATFGSKVFYKYEFGAVKGGWPELYQYIYTLRYGGLDGAKVESVNEVKLQKGKTYGGTKCEGGCFVGKEGLKKIIKISKDSPKDVFMFRQDNFSGLQPHFVKDGVIAKATVINPAYDLEKHKVRSLNIGKDVILSVRLFVSTNESVNEAASIYKDWDEFVNPHYILVTLKNGKKLKIEKKNVKGGTNVYHAILKAFNDDNYEITNKVVSGMLDRLGESVNEAKSDYEVYHKSYTSAINAAKAYAEKKGYEINDDDSFRQIGMGPRKPSEGKTNKFSIELSKDGKVQRKKLQIQVYGMKNSYELNAYIQ